jgi:putative endonuclease
MAPIRRHGRFFVYILRCRDGTLYTGFTPDLERRLALHNQGKGARYTRGRGPLELVWHREYRYFRPAVLAERRIKKLTRAAKEALVARKAR